jgi:hypothetical protein
MKLLIKGPNGYMQPVSGEVHPSLKAYAKGLLELANIGHDALIVQEASLFNPIAGPNPATGSSWEMSVSIHWFLPTNDGNAEVFELIAFVEDAVGTNFPLEIFRYDPKQPSVVPRIREMICRRVEHEIGFALENSAHTCQSLNAIRLLNEVLRILSFPSR